MSPLKVTIPKSDKTKIDNQRFLTRPSDVYLCVMCHLK